MSAGGSGFRQADHAIRGTDLVIPEQHRPGTAVYEDCLRGSDSGVQAGVSVLTKSVVMLWVGLSGRVVPVA